MEVPSQVDSWKMSDNFKDIFNRDVLPRLEKVCDEMSFNQQFTLKLDKLSIDVGSINTNEIAETWAEKIEQNFRKELQKYTSEKLNSEEKQVLLSPEQSELEVFFHFLENGVLPWYVSDQYDQTPQTLFTKLLANQPKALASKIHLSKAKAIISKRLLHQFNPDQVRQLLQHFEKPSLTAALDWVSSEIQHVKGIDFKAFEASLLLMRTVITIDSSTTNQDEAWLFQLLFEQSIEAENQLTKSDLNKLHKQLTNNRLKTKSKLSLQYQEYHLAAVKVLETTISDLKSMRDKVSQESFSITSTQQKGPSKTDEKNNGQTSENYDKDKEENQAVNATTNSSLYKEKKKQPEDHESKSDPTKNTTQPLSQDQRVWEHIERIKKAKESQPQQRPESAYKSKEVLNLSSSDLPIANLKDKPNSDTRSTSLSEKDQPSSPINPSRSTDKKEKDISDKDRTSVTTRDKTATKQTGESKAESSSQTESELEALRAKQKAVDPNPLSDEQHSETLQYWQNELESIDECYVQNAGIIVFWPYLGYFFKDMGFTTAGAFSTPAQQQQAALSLQYLLSEEPELSEHRLPLNKLLCGLPISEPISSQLSLDEDRRAKCDNLIQTAIDNWAALRGTSLEGFQNSFLNRNGVLKKHENHWQLQVEKKPFDMLMEHLPWPISIIRLSWMDKPIYVEW